MKKVEVIFEAVLLKKITPLIDEQNIEGFTLFKNEIIGRGTRGYDDGTDLHELCHKYYMIIICNDEKAKKFCSAISPLLKEYGGICYTLTVESKIP